jgi:uncharacterized cysteine cluster protein YcgN (CxxCxxCC family)
MSNRKIRCGSCQYSDQRFPNGRIKYCTIHNEQVSAQRTACAKYKQRTAESDYVKALNDLIGEGKC